MSFFVPNETELAILTGMPVGTEAEVAAAADSFHHGEGRRNRDRHDGRAQARCCIRPITPATIAAPRVTPIDTTSRRQTLVWQFRALLRLGESETVIEDSIAKAVRYAADSVTRRGTQKAYATQAQFASFPRRGRSGTR